MTTDTRLGTLEGRAEEQAAAITDLREGQRDIRDALTALSRRVDEMNERIDETNRRIDRVFFAMLGMGAAQLATFATLVTLIVSG